MVIRKRRIAIVSVIAALIVTALMAGGCSVGNLSGTMGGSLGDNVTAVKIGEEDAKEVSSVEEALAIANAEENRSKDVTVFFGTDYKGKKSISPSDRTGKLAINLQGHILSRDNDGFVNSGEIVNLGHKCNITICNGTISGGRSNNNGGAIWVDNDNVNLVLSGITITDNKSKQCGGGIYTEGCDAKVIVEDCTIKNNSSEKYGGGIFVALANGKQAKIIYKGKTVITDNIGTDDNDNAVQGRIGNLYNPTDISGLKKGAQISFTFSSKHSGSIDMDLSGDEDSISVDDAVKYLVSDNSNADIKKDKNGKLSFIPKEEYVATVSDNNSTRYYTSFDKAWNNACLRSDCDITMTLFKDWIGTDGKLGNNDLDGFDDDQLYPLDRDTWLTLDLNGYKIDKAVSSSNSRGRLFYFDEDCNMTIKNGTLTGGNCSGNAGCIYLNDKDVDLHLENMTITGNKTDGSGAAIYYNAKSSVTLQDTAITGNQTNEGSSLGTVYYRKGYLHFKGVVKICDNIALHSNANDLYFLGHAIEDCQTMKAGSKVCVSFSSGTADSRDLTESVGNIDEVNSYFSITPGNNAKIKVVDNHLYIH